MMSEFFVTQVATKEILLRVTNVCAECYSDINRGDTIHYDMKNCRYLCESCQKRLFEQRDKNSESEEELVTLFNDS